MDENFKKMIINIKNGIENTQLKISVDSNINLMYLYFRIGKILNDNFEYGNKFIDKVSKSLKLEFPTMKGFSTRNLKYMKQFYLEYKDDEVVQRTVAQLPWRHNILLMSKIKDKNLRKIYADATIKNGWGKDMLQCQIENNYHSRIGNSINNFESSLNNCNSDLVNSIIKDPYIFDFINLKNEYKEKELESALIEKIKLVLLELGKGFSFVGNQYKISTGEKEYFIDLLFYHLELRCYIVVELKINEFKPDYIGQLGFYITAIDETIKKDCDNPTIGLLLCKEKDKLSVEWSLKSSNVPIGVSSFELSKYIPNYLLEKLPTEADINQYIDFN